MDEISISGLLESLVDLLDIPPSHYRKAKGRYESLGEWLHRDGSPVAALSPSVYPQGSFRLGTVIRPLLKQEEYDLDVVCEVSLSKAKVTQEHVKELIGSEVKGHARSRGIKEPVSEGNRCWRLDYADDIRFHEDILPSIPEEATVTAALTSRGVPRSIAARAICITDKRHPRFSVISPDWLLSNPRGYAAWFESRMRPVAQARLESLVEKYLYASVDDVPAYEWKTPLQRAVQLLKRHRDVMFKNDPDCKPVSIIITTLAARAYASEGNLCTALFNIVDRMPRLVNDKPPRVPNPANPAEDFADKWATDKRLERNFRRWCAQLQTDLRRLSELATVGEVRDLIEGSLGVLLGANELRAFCIDGAADVRQARGPLVIVQSAPPRPWKRSG